MPSQWYDRDERSFGVTYEGLKLTIIISRAKVVTKVLELPMRV